MGRFPDDERAQLIHVGSFVVPGTRHEMPSTNALVIVPQIRFTNVLLSELPFLFHDYPTFHIDMDRLFFKLESSDYRIW